MFHLKMQSGKGKTGFYAIFLTFQPSSIKLRQHFRPQILWTYVHAPLGRTSINLRTYVHRNIHLRKREIVSKTAILWLTRVAYLPARESSAENIAILEAFEKAKVRNGCQLQVDMSVGCYSESLQCSSCNTPRIFPLSRFYHESQAQRGVGLRQQSRWYARRF